MNFSLLFPARNLNTSKIKMKAYVAIQRKLLVLIYTLYKNNTEFQDNFKADKSEPNPV